MRAFLLIALLSGCGGELAGNPVRSCTKNADCPAGQTCVVDPQSNSRPPGKICK